MENAARIGDATAHGGVIVSGAGSVFINGSAAAIAGVSIATCAILHGAAPVAVGSSSVSIEGSPAARISDVTGCGAVICSGSDDVFIGD